MAVQATETMTPDLSPPGLRPPGKQPVDESPASQPDRLQRMVWMLFGFVVALALVVLVILPFWVNDRKAGQDGPGQLASPATVPPLPAGVARHDAEQTLQAFLRMRAQPDLGNAEHWAPQAWQQAMDTAENGDDHYGKGDFSAARSAYESAGKQLTELLQSREKRFADAMIRAMQALDRDDAATALAAFELALAIDPANAEVRNGAARAQAREQVLRAMQDGDQAESQGDWQAAADHYDAAVRMDPAYAPAQLALQRVAEKLDRMKFQAAMSGMLAALDANRLADASDALAAAAGIYPDHPAVQDARQRLAEARRQASLARLRREAAGRVANEDWAGASGLYRQALKIDNNAVFARTGMAHAQQRMKLHAQLDHYLSDPARLASDEPLANARKLLEANRNLPEQEPLLAGKAQQLEEAIRLASLPVTLNIVSDNLTDVAVYHVGRYGQFNNRQITLRPGRYTVTGSRPGFRDVRKVVTLTPDAANMTITIRCEEPI